MSSRALLLVLLVAALSACAALPNSFEGDCVDGDGGVDDGGLELCDGPPPVRDPDPPSSDSGFDTDQQADMACDQLVSEVCGTGAPAACDDAPACAAARLLQQYERSACDNARDNDVTYPDCRPGPCSLLVDRVCGGPSDDALCAEAPGCDPAKVMLERATTGTAEERADAEASCRASLEDDVVFAACE